MNPGDIVTIAPPFGNATDTFVVSANVDANTVLVEVNEEHLAYDTSHLTMVGSGGNFTPPTKPNRRLSKLQFIAKLGPEFDTLFAASKQSLEVEKFMKMLDWATPEADGTAIDLDDPRVLYGLTVFSSVGLISPARVVEILS